jgi:tRNA(fMet)-specific endonuclease VapC
MIAKHKILDTTELSGEISSDIFAELWKKGKHSGNFDILIAGTAVANNLILVTNNTSDYENITNLKLDNWS